MRKPRFLLALLVVGVLLQASAFAASPAPRAGWPAHVRLLTGPNGGQWFVLGERMAEVLGKGMLPTTSRMGGGMANIASINSSAGDMGFSLACFLGASLSGEEEYKSINLNNTVLMANIYPQVLYFLLPRDFAEQHNIKSVKDLLQLRMPLRFASLKPGTASEFILNLLFKYGYNTSFDKLREQGWITSFNNYAETADSFVAGEIDCFAYTAGTTVPLILLMEQHTDVVILPVEEDVLKHLEKKFKTGIHVIEPGKYKSVTQPIRTLGDWTCLLVRKNLPKDFVYEANKILWENRQYLSGTVEDFGLLSPQTALPAGLEAHPGSVAFWKSLGK